MPLKSLLLLPQTSLVSSRQSFYHCYCQSFYRCHSYPHGQKTRPGRCPDQELIALRKLMINKAREVSCQGRFPASLIYVLIASPSPAVPSTLMPLPSRSTSPVLLSLSVHSSRNIRSKRPRREGGTRSRRANC